MNCLRSARVFIGKCRPLLITFEQSTTIIIWGSHKVFVRRFSFKKKKKKAFKYKHLSKRRAFNPSENLGGNLSKVSYVTNPKNHVTKCD